MQGNKFNVLTFTQNYKSFRPAYSKHSKYFFFLIQRPLRLQTFFFLEKKVHAFNLRCLFIIIIFVVDFFLLIFFLTYFHPNDLLHFFFFSFLSFCYLLVISLKFLTPTYVKQKVVSLRVSFSHRQLNIFPQHLSVKNQNLEKLLHSPELKTFVSQLSANGVICSAFQRYRIFRLFPCYILDSCTVGCFVMKSVTRDRPQNDFMKKLKKIEIF